MSNNKQDIKKILKESNAELKDGIKKVNADSKLKSQQRKNKIAEKYDRERDEYAKNKKVNYFSPTCWESMSDKTQNRVNKASKWFGAFILAFGLLIFFGAGDKTAIFLIIGSLYFFWFDTRRYRNVSNKNKK